MRSKMKFLITLNKDEENESIYNAKEIVIEGSPRQLRYLAHFILREADIMSEVGKNYGHSHLQDEWKMWERDSESDIIITAPPNIRPS